MFDLIIPDIHEKIDITDEIIARYPDCRYRYFLGDYWDSFEWEFHPDHWARVARWLMRNSNDSKNIFLIGNHDVHYFGPAMHRCSGYLSAKHQIISEIMPHNWLLQHGRWMHFVSHNDQLTVLSHAGLNPLHIRHNTSVTPGYIQELNQKIGDNFYLGVFEPLLAAGRGRGGRGIGGVTWQDWDTEFNELDGVRQIVGHTPHALPKWKNQNLCLDTHLQHVALMDTETGAITVEAV
jgi:UDP-2,3-diacylglucosamine pyrophosphatase LpxH